MSIVNPVDIGLNCLESLRVVTLVIAKSFVDSDYRKTHTYLTTIHLYTTVKLPLTSSLRCLVETLSNLPFSNPCSASPEKDRILMIHGHSKHP